MRMKDCLKLVLAVAVLGVISLGAGTTAQAKTKNVIDHKDCAATNQIFKSQGFHMTALLAKKNGLMVTALTKWQGGKRYEFAVGEWSYSNAERVQMSIYQGKKLVGEHRTTWAIHPAGQFQKDVLAQNQKDAAYIVASKNKVWSISMFNPQKTVATSENWQLAGQAAIAADLAMNRKALKHQEKSAFKQGKNVIIFDTQNDKRIRRMENFLKKYKRAAKQSPKLWKQYKQVRHEDEYVENLTFL